MCRYSRHRRRRKARIVFIRLFAISVCTAVRRNRLYSPISRPRIPIQFFLLVSGIHGYCSAILLVFAELSRIQVPLQSFQRFSYIKRRAISLSPVMIANSLFRSFHHPNLQNCCLWLKFVFEKSQNGYKVKSIFLLSEQIVKLLKYPAKNSLFDATERLSMSAV